jgi:hypothetical protein
MKKKLLKFMEALEDYGEMYFSQGSVKKDYEYITSILKFQGYYSGCRYRLYFNEDFDLIKAEERF